MSYDYDFCLTVFVDNEYCKYKERNKRKKEMAKILKKYRPILDFNEIIRELDSSTFIVAGGFSSFDPLHDNYETEMNCVEELSLKFGKVLFACLCHYEHHEFESAFYYRGKVVSMFNENIERKLEGLNYYKF